MDLNIIIALLTSLGIGGIIGGYINNLLEKKKEIEMKQNQINEEKYRSILLYMLALLDNNNLKHCQMSDINYINSLTEDERNVYLIEKLKINYYFSIINTSSKETLISIKKFIKNPNIDNYIEVAINMKNDLWGKTKNLIIEDLKLK